MSSLPKKISLMALLAFGSPMMINRATHAAQYSPMKAHYYWAYQTPKPTNYCKPLGQLPYTAYDQHQDTRVWQRCSTA
jgi:hypothetical protein